MVAVYVLLSLTGATAGAQQRVTIAPDQQYVALEVLRLSNLEAELNDAGQQGFRLRQSAVNEARVMALLERANPKATFEYRIVSVSAFTTNKADKEMNAVALEGYRVVPHTFMVKKGVTIFNVENVVLMERASTPSGTYEYKTLAAVRTAALDRDVKAALSEGWQVFDMVYGQILLERRKN